MNLQELRLKYNITQQEASAFLGIPARTYRRYESDETYGDPLKRQVMAEKLTKQYEITETQGILTPKQIAAAVSSVLENYQDSISFCYLFGSYAKGLAKESSDIDLYVDSKLTGFAFVGLISQLHDALHKKVDVIRPSELKDNIELTNEIMKWGIRIYG